eukprot:gene3091-6064_t
MVARKGRVLRMYDTRAVFENLETGNCVVVTQVKEGWARDLVVCDVKELGNDLGSPSQKIPLEAIFGIYDLLSGSYVAVIVESEPFVSVHGIDIRKVKKTLIVPLFRHGRLLSDRKQRDEDKYLELLHSGFSQHNLFFSTTNDITHTQQRLEIQSSKHISEPNWIKADDRFFWNRDVVIDLVACKADEWIMPIMSAYIEIAPECVVEDEKFTLLFISRRSRYRQGCRFTKRGVDEYGHVANFVETEQILIFPDGRLTSYVQTRGSIPVVWSSPVHLKYDPIVYIDENRQKSIEYCQRHVVSELLSQYCDINGNSNLIFINLIDKKKDQLKLGIEFKEVFDQVELQVSLQHEMKYIWFDFHHECKQKGKWKNLSKLILSCDESFRQQGYFSKLSNGIVRSWQIGCIRTNCMDNLDRTNVVQSLFARRSLIFQLNKTGILDSSNVLETPWKKFEEIYKSVWANNANQLSSLYAGTGALKVDFTKTGKRTINGMIDDGINACKRYYINNFLDGYKQDSIDIMLGYYKPDHTGPSPFQIRSKIGEHLVVHPQLMPEVNPR